MIKAETRARQLQRRRDTLVVRLDDERKSRALHERLLRGEAESLRVANAELSLKYAALESQVVCEEDPYDAVEVARQRDGGDSSSMGLIDNVDSRNAKEVYTDGTEGSMLPYMMLKCRFVQLCVFQPVLAGICFSRYVG